MKIEVKHIGFEDIEDIWKRYLWLGRTSAIETHSAIVYLSEPYSYNSDYFKNIATFLAVYVNDQLAGVNSGHMAGDRLYRSRGLYVLKEYRSLGLGQLLLTETTEQGAREGATACWSMPRISSLDTYKHVGFVQTSRPFGTETSDANVYAISQI